MTDLVEFEKKQAKTCSACDGYKDFTQFYNNKRRPDGKDNICKTCRRAKNNKTWRKKNPEVKRVSKINY